MMRSFVYLALAIVAFLSIAACSETSDDPYDNYTHNGYPGPSPRTEGR